eukprot:s2257_g3.t1
MGFHPSRYLKADEEVATENGGGTQVSESHSRQLEAALSQTIQRLRRRESKEEIEARREREKKEREEREAEEQEELLQRAATAGAAPQAPRRAGAAGEPRGPGRFLWAQDVRRNGDGVGDGVGVGRTEGSPRVPRVLLEQRLAPLSPEKGQESCAQQPMCVGQWPGRQHAWSLDATLSLPPPLSPSASPSLPRPSAVASSASPAPERRRLEPLRTRRWRCRSQDMTDPQDSPLKGRLQRALAQRRASEEVQSARKGTVREHKRSSVEPNVLGKATTQIDLIEGRPVTKSEREKWDAAFARYQLDGEIHVDELKGALVMCGFCDARPTVVQKVLEGLTKFNSLNKAEFYLFVCRFEAGLHETYEFEFNLLDTGHREPWQQSHASPPEFLSPGIPE